MITRIAACTAAFALLGAAPSSTSSPAATSGSAPAKSLTVTCSSAPFYYYPRMSTPTDRPVRSTTPPVTPGQRFGALRMRTTLQSVQYVETNVGANLDLSAVPHSNLWLLRNCVSVD